MTAPIDKEVSVMSERNVDYAARDMEDAFGRCRDRDRPLVVTVEIYPDDMPHPFATQFKVYPSGHALWAYDGHNPFQTWS